MPTSHEPTRSRVLRLNYEDFKQILKKENMNDPEKITSAKIIEEQEQLKVKYEDEIKTVQQANLNLQNTILKKDNEIFELQKENESVTKDRDEWKTEAHRNRRIEQAKKETKEQNDFLTEWTKLQEAKPMKGARI